MTTIDRLRKILGDSLQLGSRASALSAGDRLLGSIPEFDSMAVVTVITMIEDEFGVTVDDDELSAEVFETLGSLERFVSGKLQR
jgi:acyl carrier protein